MILKIIFYTLSSFLIIATLLPLIRKDHWTFRVFEFPRIQKFTLVVFTFILGAILLKYDPVIYGFLGALLIITIHLGYLIVPYTPLSRKTLRGTKSSDECFSLMISNVYQDNTRYDKLRRRVTEVKPDLLLMVETDDKWRKELEKCTKEFPYKLEMPLDNTYGMLFYSKFELVDPEFRYLVSDEYPSIRTGIKLTDGTVITFYGLHPPPPSPTEETYSTERDNELMKVAKEVEDKDGPTLVAGDLNDVAWSYTTENFIKISGLLDPRKGRGIYATFNAKNILMRWPLDHIFCSNHFELVSMKRLKNINSDHFPVLVNLSPAISGSRQR